MRLSIYILISLFLGLFMPLHAASQSTESDTCRPTYSDIYSFNVGDVFQYRIISTSSAGGVNPTQESISQYRILDKIINSNNISYYINGWKKSQFYQNSLGNEYVKVDTSKDFEFIDEYIEYIDSASNFLNMCPKDLVQLPGELFMNMILENVYSKIQLSYSDSNLNKTIGGEGNIFKYNENDSLVQIGNMYFEAVYQKGFGLISQAFTFPEIKETIELEAYVKGQDTVGRLLSGEYPEYAATSNNEIFSKEPILIYPNPTNGILTIKNAELEIISAEIFNISGQKVFYKQFPIQQLDISFLKSGIYFIKLNLIDGEFRSQKISIR